MADVILNITIPDGVKQQKTIEAWTAEADTDGVVMFRGHLDDGGKDYEAEAHFRIEPQQPGESLLDFGKRFAKAVLVATVKAHGDKVRSDADREDIESLVPHVNEVPDDVLT